MDFQEERMSKKSKKIAVRLLPILIIFFSFACNFGFGLDAGTPAASPAELTAGANSASADSTSAVKTQASSTEKAASAPTVTATFAATATASATAQPPVVYPLGPTGYPAYVNPLTGLAVNDPTLLKRRPIAVKVSNFPRTARPQAGLSKADIIFEWYTEHGSTRFIGLFYGQNAEKVGPIRSVRMQDFAFMPLYDSVLVYIAGFAPVIQQMNLLGIDAVQELGPGSQGAMWRDDETVNGVFTDIGKMTQYVQHIGLDPKTQPNLNGMAFDPTPPTTGADSIGVKMIFSSAAIGEWKYDTASKRYLRFSEDDAGKMVPLTDRMTKQQLAIDNLIVLFVPTAGCYVDGLGTDGITRVIDAELWKYSLKDSGNAYFFRDGKMVHGLWKNGGNNSPLQFVGSDGKPFFLHPGSSYITVVPTLAPFGKLSTSEWQFFGNPGNLQVDENGNTIVDKYGQTRRVVPLTTEHC
jgi:hypothetical protein